MKKMYSGITYLAE